MARRFEQALALASPTYHRISNQSTDDIPAAAPLKSLQKSDSARVLVGVDSPASESFIIQPHVDYTFRQHWTWKFRKIFSESWLWEWIACITSLLLLVVICAVLLVIRNRDVSYWSMPWSVASVLALVITILKGMMMVPVSSALGQLKWNWFRKSESLEGMELFDDASRGPLGSIIFLVALKARHLASIGAFVTVLSLSLDVLVQNAVQLRTRDDHTTSSYIMRTTNYNSISIYGEGVGFELPIPKMTSSISYVMASGSDPSIFEPELVFCASNNCTFPHYQTLAVEAQCAEANVEVESSRYIHSSDSSLYLDASDGLINSTTRFDYPEDGRFHNLGPLITRWLILANPDTRIDSPFAAECAFYWAVHTYSAEFVNNDLDERLHESWTNSSSRDTTGSYNITLNPPTCWADGEMVNSSQTEQSNCSYAVASYAHRSFQTFFDFKHYSFHGQARNTTMFSDSYTSYSYSSLLMHSLLEQLSLNDGGFDAVNKLALNVARASTIQIRQLTIFENETTGDIGRQYGTTIWVPKTYYYVRWGYIVVAVLLVTLSAVFFIGTTFVTRKEQLWKTSQLATIFHGLSPYDVSTFGNVEGYADIRGQTKGTQVRLVHTDLGEKLVSDKAYARSKGF